MKKIFFTVCAFFALSISMNAMDPVVCPNKTATLAPDYFMSHIYCAVCTDLTPTGRFDNGKELMLTVDGDSCKISDDKCFIDFHWADPSSVVFDNVYVSEDGYYDITWYYVIYNIDGEPTMGSLTHFYINDELFEDDIVYMTVPGTYCDSSKVEGAELYSDWPNEIRLTKGNGWPLVYGIKLTKSKMSNLNTVSMMPYKVFGEQGQVRVRQLEKNATISVYSLTGTLVDQVTTSESECVLPLKSGVYMLKINNCTIKAVVR